MGKPQRVIITPVFTEDLLAGGTRRLRFRPVGPFAPVASEAPAALASESARPTRAMFRAV